MALAGKGLLAIWNDIEPQLRESFLDWHPREHVPQRLANPNFVRGRRYAAVDADIEFFTLYEAIDIDAFASPAYMAQSQSPTVWSRSVTPGFRNTIRGVCGVRYSAGHATGGWLTAIRLGPAEGRGDSLIDAAALLLARVLERSKVVGVHYGVCDPARSHAKANAQQTSQLVLPEHVALVESSSIDGVVRATDELLGDEQLLACGARPRPVRGHYRLDHVATNIGGLVC